MSLTLCIFTYTINICFSCLSVCLSIYCFSIWLSLYPSTFNLSIHHFIIYLYIYLSIYLSVCLPIYLFDSLSTKLSVCLSIHQTHYCSVFLSFYLSILVSKHCRTRVIFSNQNQHAVYCCEVTSSIHIPVQQSLGPLTVVWKHFHTHPHCYTRLLPPARDWDPLLLRPRLLPVAPGPASTGHPTGAGRLSPPLTEPRPRAAPSHPTSTAHPSWQLSPTPGHARHPRRIPRANRRPGAHRRRRGLLRPGAGFSAPVVSGRWRSGLIWPGRRGSAGPRTRPDPVGVLVLVRIWSGPAVGVIGVIRHTDRWARLLLRQDRHDRSGWEGVRFNDSERVWTFKLERLLSRNTRLSHAGANLIHTRWFWG